MNNNNKRITDLSESYVSKFSLMTTADFWLASGNKQLLKNTYKDVILNVTASPKA